MRIRDARHDVCTPQHHLLERLLDPSREGAQGLRVLPLGPGIGPRVAELCRPGETTQPGKGKTHEDKRETLKLLANDVHGAAGTFHAAGRVERRRRGNTVATPHEKYLEHLSGIAPPLCSALLLNVQADLVGYALWAAIFVHAACAIVSYSIQRCEVSENTV